MADAVPRARRGRWRWGCLTVLLVAAFACGCGALVYAVAPPPPLDILVLGLDAPLGADPVSADSVTLVGVNPAGLQVSLLTLPGDTPLDSPGFGQRPIGSIYSLAEVEGPGSGVAFTSAALENTLGVGVDRVVRLRYEDLVALVDAAGGVWVDVERTIRDEAYPVSDTETTVVEFSPGMQRMDGERALQYVRTRHADDPAARANRQLQVMQALTRQMRNPLVWPAVWAAWGSVETDLTLTNVLSLAPVLLLNAGRFEQRALDESLVSAGSDGTITVNWAALRPWLAGRFD